MAVTLFIQEREGDYNLEKSFITEYAAKEELRYIADNKGYYTKDRDGNIIWMPFHRIVYARIEKTESE